MGDSADVEKRRVRDAVRGGLFGAPRSTLRIGRYELRDRLGEGGAGVVYRAYDPRLDRVIALKLMAPAAMAMAEAEDVRRARLLREARAMARIQHPHVVAVHDVGEHDGQVFIAMELVEGETFRAWSQRVRDDIPRVLTVAIGAGEGLAAAHGHGLLHRDFKPENVIVDRNDVARVLDFGLVRVTEVGDKPETLSAKVSLSARLTQTGAVLGTPAYLARELLVGGTVDARIDQYAFCVVLYEAIYGERPYRGERLEQLLRSIVTGATPEPPPKRGVPKRLREVLLRGLSSDPKHRFASMEALLGELRALKASPTSGVSKPMLLGLALALLVAVVVSSYAVLHAISPGEAPPEELSSPEEMLGPEVLAYPMQVNAFAQSRPEIDFCAQSGQPATASEVVVSFEITSAGQARGVRVLADTTGDSQVLSCVVRQVSRWQFPRPPGGRPTSQRLSFQFP